jgi:A/G-specific adenine glycosylase
VLARAFSGRRLTSREAQDLADAVVPAGRAWEWNQAMLDLGATMCTKRAPRCDGCPILAACAWVRGGRSDPDPAEGTAGTGGRQSAFAGSDREGRGRLVSALRRAPVPLADAALASGWPDDAPRAARVLDGLIDDGLVTVTDDTLTLAPG